MDEIINSLLNKNLDASLLVAKELAEEEIVRFLNLIVIIKRTMWQNTILKVVMIIETVLV